MKKILFIILYCLFVVPPTFAQTDTGCNAKAIGAEYTKRLAMAVNLEELDQIHQEMTSVLANCQGLAFEGFNSRVVGPFDVPPGKYTITITTTGDLVQYDAIFDGVCNYTERPTVNITNGGATNGIENHFESQGCRMLMLITTTTAPWTITFEPVEALEVPVPTTAIEIIMNPEDAAAGIEAAFAGDFDRAAEFMCDDEVDEMRNDTAFTEATASAQVFAEATCENEGSNIMICDVAISVVLSGETEPTDLGSVTVRASVVDGKLCGEAE